MKFMNLKRFASTVMAGALALSLAVPAFASGNTSTNITGTYRAITVNVVVPTTGQAIINPYGLPIEMGSSTVSGQQITTGAPLVIQNKSAVPLSVSASIASSKKGNFVFSSADLGSSENGNKGKVEFQMFEAPAVVEANATDMDVLNPIFAALKDDDSLCHTVLTETNTTANPAVPAVEEADIITLNPANSDGELVAGGAAFFRLSGTVVKKPSTAWTASDGFTAKVTFTFEPTVLTGEAGTIAVDAGGALELNSGSTTTADVTLTPDLPTGVTVATWTWSSSDQTKATVAVNNTDSKKATVTHVASGTGTITVTGTGSDGTVYSATIDFTCA